MAKNPRVGNDDRSGANRDGTVVGKSWPKHTHAEDRAADQKRSSSVHRVRREILFPTEPTTIDHSKIDRAVERVMSRKK